MNYGRRFVTLYRRQESRPCLRKRNAKWLSEEALQIAVKGRQGKSKGEKERYIHLNAEFQRRARRDKKAFLSDQCKEIAENNRIGKTSDLFKKIRDTKGTFHAKMGSIKDRNGMDFQSSVTNFCLFFCCFIQCLPYEQRGWRDKRWRNLKELTEWFYVRWFCSLLSSICLKLILSWIVLWVLCWVPWGVLIWIWIFFFSVTPDFQHILLGEKPQSPTGGSCNTGWLSLGLTSL